MSYTDVGKDAKRKGVTHPKHARKMDHEPPKATPKATPHRKAKKLWGYSYEIKWRLPWRSGWDKRAEWFDRKTSRDQSFARWSRQMPTYGWYRNIQIIDPTPDNSRDSL